jgi:glucosamine kinase
VKLIADSGATKTHWVLLDGRKKSIEFYSPGFNPYYYDREQFRKSLNDALRTNLETDLVKEIHFYGSGVSSEENREIVRNSLSFIFPKVKVSVYHDLHGAAVALLGHEQGIACILGTGSNSCLWNGKEIIANVPSLGYLLGDEGSGTYMGKLLVRDVLIGEADPQIATLFFHENKLDFAGTLDRIYKEKYPNRFFSEQAKFLRKYRDTPYSTEIIIRNFEDFVRVQISKYPGYDKLPVSFTGSVAANFRDLLQEVLKKHSIKMGIIMKEPMEGLLRYHGGGKEGI